MSNITYKIVKPKGGIYRESVFVDGKKAGEIHSCKHAEGLEYVPKGKRSGNKVFRNIESLKASLENEQ